MDKIVQQVIAKFNERSAVGIKKYGTTLADNNKDDYLNHLQEELMDAVLYIEKLKTQRKEMATNCSQPVKLINEYYLLRNYWCDVGRDTEKMNDILLLVKNQDGVTLKSITMEKVSPDALKLILGENYETILIY